MNTYYSTQPAFRASVWMFCEGHSPLSNAAGAFQNGGELSHASGSSRAAPISRSNLNQRKRQFSLLTSLHSLLVLMGGRPQAASLVRGLRPRNAPGPITCLIDRVPVFATGAQSTEFLRPRSLQSHRIPVGAGLVPALAHHPIYGPRDKSQPGACLPSLQEPVNDSSHSWHEFPARLFPPQFCDAPNAVISCQRLCRRRIMLLHVPLLSESRWLTTGIFWTRDPDER